jgi:hypothetical protein
MIEKTDAERIAAAVHALRPDWPVSSLMTLLAELRTWPLRDLAVKLTWIATDQDHAGNYVSQTPARVKETGPWSSIGINENNLQAARDRASRELAERKRAIKERSDAVRSCTLCDHEGRLENGWLCRHDVDTNTRSQVAKFYADKARKEIRPMRKLGDITKELTKEGNPA